MGLRHAVTKRWLLESSYSEGNALPGEIAHEAVKVVAEAMHTRLPLEFRISISSADTSLQTRRSLTAAAVLLNVTWRTPVFLEATPLQ